MNANLNINNIRTHYASLSELEQDAASRDTSVEIMYAIAERADDTSDLESIWENGTYGDAIITRAWELASDDTDELFWGDTSFCR